MITIANFIKPRLFPLCGLTCCLIIGIWWQSHAYPLWYIIAAAIATNIISLVPHYPVKLNTRYYILLCSLFAMSGAYRLQKLIDKQKQFQQKTNKQFYNILGRVTDSIKTGNPRLPQRITLQLISLQSCENNILSPIMLYIYTKRLRGIRVADTISIKHVLFHHNYNAEFNNYLLKENCGATVVLQNHTVQRLCRPKYSFWRWLYYTRKELVDRLQHHLQPITYLYFSSIFLGSPETKKMINPIKQHLQQWGIVHYLARSGLHVVIFITLWQLLLRFVPLSILIKELILILLCIIYTLFSWPSIPFHRAFFTFLITRCCTLSSIRVYYLPVLAVVTIATLLINPFFLFSLDFQLSFGITAALAWFNEIQTNSQVNR